MLNLQLLCKCLIGGRIYEEMRFLVEKYGPSHQKPFPAETDRAVDIQADHRNTSSDTSDAEGHHLAKEPQPATNAPKNTEKTNLSLETSKLPEEFQISQPQDRISIAHAAPNTIPETIINPPNDEKIAGDIRTPHHHQQPENA